MIAYAKKEYWASIFQYLCLTHTDKPMATTSCNGKLLIQLQNLQIMYNRVHCEEQNLLVIMPM